MSRASRPCSLLLSLLLTAPLAQADTLLTLDGQRLEGTTSLTPTHELLFTPTPPAGPLTLTPTNILSLTLTNPPKPALGKVTLRSGSITALQSIGTLKNNAFSLTRVDGPELSLPLPSLATLEIGSPPNTPSTPPPNSTPPTNPPFTPGIQLTSGDFLPGKLTTFSRNRLTVVSTLFGPRSLSPRDAAAIRFAQPNAPTAAFRVAFTDGSLFAADTLTFSATGLTLTDPALGTRTAPLADLLSITRSPTLTTPLSAKLPPSLSDADPIPLTLGTDLTIPLAGRYGALLATFRVTPTQLPLAAVRLTVLLDGQPTYQSPQLHSLSDPVSLSIPLTNKSTLTLHLDASGPLAASAELLNAQLIPTPTPDAPSSTQP